MKRSITITLFIFVMMVVQGQLQELYAQQHVSITDTSIAISMQVSNLEKTTVLYDFEGLKAGASEITDPSIPLIIDYDINHVTVFENNLQPGCYRLMIQDWITKECIVLEAYVGPGGKISTKTYLKPPNDWLTWKL